MFVMTGSQTTRRSSFQPQDRLRILHDFSHADGVAMMGSAAVARCWIVLYAWVLHERWPPKTSRARDE